MKTYAKTLGSVPALLILTFSLLITAACGPLSETSSESAAANVAANTDILKRSLGSGYDSARNLKIAPCIEPSAFVYTGTNYSNLSYLRDFTYQELLDEMDVELYGKVNIFGLFKAKISGEMTTTLAKTDESSAFIYKFDVIGKSAVLKSPSLNAKGMGAYQRNDPLHFRENCGDEYVEQVQLGGQLFIGVKYTFTNSEDKEVIRAKLKMSALWGLIKKTKTWTKEERDILKNVHISIEAYQIGGDTRKLTALKDSMKNRSCAGHQIDLCAKALDVLLHYATHGFAKQLNGMDVSKDPNLGPAIVGVTTVPYNAYPLMDSSHTNVLFIDVKADQTIKSTFTDAMNRLSRLQTELNISLARAKILMEFPMTPAEKAKLQVSRRTLEGLVSTTRIIMNDTCVPAKKDNSLIPKCVARVGAIEVQGAKALVPITLSSR